MKLAFLLLVLANLALFAWQQGVFGRLPEAGREPERVNRQIEPDRIRVLTPPEVRALRDKAKLVPPAAATDVRSAPDLACLEFGDFVGEVAARAQKRLDVLNLADRLSVRAVDAAGWYQVYVPPFRTRADADRRADDLRRLGIKEMLVIADNSPLRFGISLGSFRDQELAVKYREDLVKRGIKDARVADRPASVPATRFQIKNVDAALARELNAMQKEFAQQKLAACS